MAYFTWDPELETGHDDIDSQHRSLFELANALERAIQNDVSGRAEDIALADAVYGLVDYVVEHFAAEEALMVACGYPGLGPHRALHEELSGKVLTVMARYTNGEELACAELAPLICDLLTGHIEQHDKSVVRFLIQVETQRSAQ